MSTLLNSSSAFIVIPILMVIASYLLTMLCFHIASVYLPLTLSGIAVLIQSIILSNMVLANIYSLLIASLSVDGVYTKRYVTSVQLVLAPFYIAIIALTICLANIDMDIYFEGLKALNKLISLYIVSAIIHEVFWYYTLFMSGVLAIRYTRTVDLPVNSMYIAMKCYVKPFLSYVVLLGIAIRFLDIYLAVLSRLFGVAIYIIGVTERWRYLTSMFIPPLNIVLVRAITLPVFTYVYRTSIRNALSRYIDQVSRYKQT